MFAPTPNPLPSCSSSSSTGSRAGPRMNAGSFDGLRCAILDRVGVLGGSPCAAARAGSPADEAVRAVAFVPARLRPSIVPALWRILLPNGAF